MLRIKANFLAGVLLALPLLSFCQDWKALFQAKGPSTVLSRGVEMAPNNDLYWIGIFEQYVVIGPDTLHSAGSADGFICKFGSNGIQKWSLRFGGIDLDRVMSTTVDQAGNLYLTGGFSDEIIFGNDTLFSPNRDVFVVKYDTSGHAVWAKSVAGNSSDFGQGIVTDPSGHVYITGIFMSDSLAMGSIKLHKQGSSDMFLIKLDSTGNPLWAKQGGGSSTTLGNALALDSLNHIYLTGSFQDSASFSGQWLYSQGRSDAYVACYESSGTLNWIRAIAGAGFDAGQALAGTQDGVLITGRYSDVLSLDTVILGHQGSYDIFMADYNANGQVKWAKSIGGMSKDGSYGLDYRKNTGIYLVGEYSAQVSFDQKNMNSQGGTDAFLAKYDLYGNNRWVLAAGGMGNEQAYAAFVSPSQNIYFAGHFRDVSLFDSTALTSGGRDDGFLAHIRDLDSIPPPPVTILPLDGRIFEDRNLNCLSDSQELGYHKWFVVAEPGPYFGLSDEKGDFNLDVSPGTYQVKNLLPNDLSSWLYSNCPPMQFFSTGSGGPAQSPFLLPFGQAEKAKAQLQLSMDADDFVRCQPGHLVIDYVNIGSAPANNVTIMLTMPEEVSILNSSSPFRSLSMGRLHFSIPGVLPQQSGQIDIQYITSCNSLDLMGKNLSVKAEIHSPNIAEPLDVRWNGAELKVSGSCYEEDSSLFVIKNIGTADLADSVEIRFFADDVFCNTTNIWLAQGDSLGLLVPTSGKTIRCEVRQAAFHPRGSWILATVEACSPDSRFPVSLGFHQHFTQYDASPTSRFQLNRQLFDSIPAMYWQVTPAGRGRQHIIESGERLYYHISFQAPANQALHKLQITDTLPQWLDPASMRWEARSHHFDIAVDGKGFPVLHFELIHDSLMAAERGFIAFSFMLKPRTPEGTQIRQRAWVKTDTLMPAATSWVFHTVGKDLLDRGCRLPILPYTFATPVFTAIDPSISEQEISIYPNPFAHTLQFRFPTADFAQTIRIYDLSGKQMMFVKPKAGKEFLLEVSALPSGIYFVHIDSREIKRVFKVIKK